MLKHIPTNKEENLLTGKTQLVEFFYSGFKDCKEKKTGLEFEKLPVLKESFKSAPYVDVVKFLNEYGKANWQSIVENNSILGLKNQEGIITLEPGSQTELSLEPSENLFNIKQYIDIYNTKTAQIADKFGILWLGCGIQPVSTYKSINIIPKKRYEYMTRYLPTVAKKPLVMMRETAGIQSSFDYKNEEDAMKKFSIALKLSPIVSAAFSNSPVRNGHLTKFKSYRASSWLDTDNARCGLVSSKAFTPRGFSFENYAEILLDVPMIFIEREIDSTTNEKTAIKIENTTFRQFLRHGYHGLYPTKADWELHLSLYFPDVRFKNYIEIRNHDNQKKDNIMAVPAFWKGIIYNDEAINAVNELLKSFSYFDFEYIRRKTPQKGLDIKIKNYKLSELAKEIFNISFQSLKSYKDGEEVLLEPFKTIIDSGKTPADIIIENWEKDWHCDISELIKYSQLY